MGLSSDLFVDNRHQGKTTLEKIQLIELRMLKYVDYICNKYHLVYWLDGGTLLGAIRHKGFIPWDDDVDIVMPRKDYNKFIQIARNELPDDCYIFMNKDADYNNFYVSWKIYDRYSSVTDGSAQDVGHGVFLDINIIDDYSDNKWVYKVQSFFVKPIYRILCRNSHKMKYDKMKFSFYYFVFFIINLIPKFFGKRYAVELMILIIDFNFKYFNRFESQSVCGYGFDVYWSRIFKKKNIFPLIKRNFCGFYFNTPKCSYEVLKVFYGDKFMVLPDEKERNQHHIKSVIIDTRVTAEIEKLN